MRTLDQFFEKMRDYREYDFIWCSKGYISWRRATGDNLEVTFTEASQQRKGYGKELFRMMIQKIEKDGTQPFHSVVDWILGERVGVQKFFESMGFTLTHLGDSVYRDDDTVLAVIPYDELKKNLGL